MDTIRISIKTFSGDQCLEWVAPLEYDVGHLKTVIEGTLGIPSLFQRLASGTVMLRDSCALVYYMKPGDTSLQVTVSISLDDVQRHLSSGSPQKQCCALADLGKLGPKAGHVFNAVAACLQDEDYAVRRAAVGALARIAEKGDRRAITTVFAYLEDEKSFVRSDALRALVQLAPKGDHPTIMAVASCLEDTDDCVRYAAVLALSQIAEKNDQHAITAAAACLQDEMWDVRHVAVLALKKLSDKGNQRAITAVTSCLKDENECVKDAAVLTLSQLVEKGDQHASTAKRRKL